MATSDDYDKTDGIRPRAYALGSVVKLSTPEVQPSLGKHQQKDSAKNMLVNIQEERPKGVGKKLRRSMTDRSSMTLTKADKKMLKRGIVTDTVDQRARSVTLTPVQRQTSLELPSSRIRRLSLPPEGLVDQSPPSSTLQQLSLHGSRDQSHDSGVAMDTTECKPRTLTSSSSLDDLVDEHRPRAATQEQFPMSFVNYNSTGVDVKVEAVSPPCPEDFGHFQTEQGDCVVCSVLHGQSSMSDEPFINHLMSEHREIVLHNRDSGIGNDIHMNALANIKGKSPPPPLQIEMVQNPVHIPMGSGFSQSMELPTSDMQSPLREKDFFETTNDLAKESAHFTMAELLIAAAEEYKCINEEKLSAVGHSSSKKRDDIDSDVGPPPKLVHSSFDSPTTTTATTTTPSATVSTSSAGHTAQQLLKHIGEMVTRISSTGSASVMGYFTTAVASRQLESVAQSLASNRGDEQWAPPRQQVIFTLPPSMKRHDALRQQEYRCHGCGLRVDKELSKHFRYCNYSGRYFCLSCHTNALDVLPAMVLNKWVFKKFSVSNYAKTILDKTRNEPVFVIDSIKPDLYHKVIQLDRIRHLRLQLVAVRRYLVTCKFSQDVLERLQQMKHLSSEVHVYSLADLIAVNAGQVQRPLQNVLTDSIKHVRTCDLCKQRGFICEFCKDPHDILYPFELDRVVKCKCSGCFHKGCYIPEKCPRCIRLRLRREQRIAVDSFS